MNKITLKVEVDKDLYEQIKNGDISYKDITNGIIADYYVNLIKNATPLTESEDYIIRQAVLNYLTEQLNFNEDRRSSENYTGHWVEEEQYSYAVDVLEKFDEYVRALPPVLSKREQGEWIFEEVGVRTQVLKCSKCGTIIQRGENFTQEEFRKYINDILREKCITLDNFCPNCGAEMR